MSHCTRIGFTFSDSPDIPHAPLIDDGHSIFISPLIEPGGVRHTAERVDRTLAVEAAPIEWEDDLVTPNERPIPNFIMARNSKYFFESTTPTTDHLQPVTRHLASICTWANALSPNAAAKSSIV